MQRICLVHYHEIGLKGHNRVRFERLLAKNLVSTLSSCDVESVERISGHLCVTVSDAGQLDRIRNGASRMGRHQIRYKKLL